MSRPDRPLSPHLQIYRWELTMLLSILHRATGVALSAGCVVLVAWVFALAYRLDEAAALHAFIGSTPGQALLMAWTFALFLHMGNGIRHLFWDVGIGFEMAHARASGWAVLVFAAGATLLAWGLA